MICKNYEKASWKILYSEEYLELKYVGELKELKKEKIDFLDEIVSYIKKSDALFVYREYLHNKKINATALWVKQNSKKFYDMIVIDYDFYDNRETIIAENDEKIYYLNLDDEKRIDFLDNFRLSSKPLSNLKVRYNNSKGMLVNDDLFEEYNYIFTKNGEIVMMIDSHTFEVLVCG